MAPFIPDDPPTVIEMTKTERTTDNYRMLDFTVRIDPNNPYATTVAVTWALGYVASNVYYPVKTRTYLAKGLKVLQQLSAAPTELTRYADIQKAIWTVLQLEGQVPTGEITP